MTIQELRTALPAPSGQAEGGVAGGYTLYIQNGKPVYEYNYFAHERYKVVSSETLSPGAAVIPVDFKYDGGGIGKGGTAALFIDGQRVGEGRVEKTCPSPFGAESFDVGMDNGSPVSENYRSPFVYSGTIKKAEISIQPAALKASDRRKIREAELAAAMVIE